MLSILPKNEHENFIFCPSLLGQKSFVRFWGELKTPKSPYEINWPLHRTIFLNYFVFNIGIWTHVRMFLEKPREKNGFFLLVYNILPIQFDDKNLF